MLNGKKILIGVTGSIAAYKSILLVRLLVRAGAEVKVILTPDAEQFVTPLTLSVLSKNLVLRGLTDHASWNNHVELGRWADLFLIAPLSANTLAKMAGGLCDNLLMAVYLSAKCPVCVAPAMDEDMWQHPATIKNLSRVRSFGNMVIEVAKGELASGLFGEGRLSEPEDILNFIGETYFRTRELEGKTALVTAGPTQEPLDPVRYISNHSSGKMGYALACALHMKGAAVTLVSGPSYEKLPYGGICMVRVQTADEMFKACQKHSGADIILMNAAVADYTPVKPEKQKMKKKEEHVSLDLIRTVDILKYLGEHKRKGQFVAGFALETENGREYARAKLNEKHLDAIVLNSITDPGAGFGHDTNKVTIMDERGEHVSQTKSKKEIASDVVGFIVRRVSGYDQI